MVARRAACRAGGADPRDGLILAPALAVEAFLQWRVDPVAAAGGLAGGRGVGIRFGVYLVVNQVVYGAPFAFSVIQREHWFKNLTWPWVGLEGTVAWLSNANPDSALMYGGMELVFIALGFVATVATALWLRPTWAVWMAGNSISP